jgi:hypothetical protein
MSGTPILLPIFERSLPRSRLISRRQPKEALDSGMNLNLSADSSVFPGDISNGNLAIDHSVLSKFSR